MPRIYWNGSLLSCTRNGLKVDGIEIAVPFMERKLLLFFMEHPDVALTREQLLKEVWGYETAGVTRTVDTHVKNLRAHLGRLGALIVTVRGTGYRLDTQQSQAELCFCKAS